MSAFSSISEFWQTMLPFIMLVEIVLEIGLFMYQLLRSNKPVRSLLSLAVMAVMIPLLFSVSQADPDNIGDAFLLDAPWLIFAAAIFLAAVHFAIALPREYRRKKNELSPFSIKEATDKLAYGHLLCRPERQDHPVQQPYAQALLCPLRPRAANQKRYGKCPERAGQIRNRQG